MNNYHQQLIGYKIYAKSKMAEENELPRIFWRGKKSLLEISLVWKKIHDENKVGDVEEFSNNNNNKKP